MLLTMCVIFFNLLSNLRQVSGSTVILLNGHSIPIHNIGSVSLFPGFTLHNVLFVPSFHFNILSISALTEQLNYSVNFFSTHCDIQDLTQARKIGMGRRFGNLYVLDSSNCFLVSNSLCNSASLSIVDLWHYRLGHPSLDKLHLLQNDLNINTFSDSHFHCSICPLAKQHRLPFHSANNISPSSFDLLHLDIWGPFTPVFVEGYKYFLTIVDDSTRYTWIYFLRNKYDVHTIFPAFYTLVQN